MAKITRCEQPGLDQLARTDPSLALKPYFPIINAQIGYWQRIQRSAEQEAKGVGSMVMANVGHSMHELLQKTFEDAAAERLISRDLDAYKHARLFMLGMTAVSLFVRRYRFDINSDRVDDAQGSLQPATFVLDTYNNPNLPPQTPRLHMLPEFAELVLDVSDEPDGWYDAGQLYVHYSSTAEPTSEQQRALYEHEIAVDFAPLVTITPELRRR